LVTTGGIERNKNDLAGGTQIGRYRIEVPVGRGGMGTVYSAFDETTNRVVALKLLAEGISPSLRDRFLAECEAEANIRHEHVMPVYDRGWLTEERPYFVMELLYQPVTLTDIMVEIDRGSLGASYPRIRHWNDLRKLIADVLLPICEGVHVANTEYGIQHRDLKPDNVLIDIRTKRAYLIDFGICRPMDDEQDIGKIVGTPRFLSPEQAAGQVDERTDVWGLGALLRYAVTGEPPILGTSPFTRQEVDQRVEALKKAEAGALADGNEAKARGFAGRRTQLEDPTLRVQEDLLGDAVGGVYLPLPEGTSAGLTAIIKKAMARRSEDRYANAGLLVRDLRTWLSGGSVQALSEEGARGALADYMRRLLNRNVVRTGGSVVTLLMGFLIGSGRFSQTPPPANHRLEDAEAVIARLDAEAIALRTEPAGDGMTPLGTSALLDFMTEEANEADQRLLSEPESPERSRVAAAHDEMRSVLDRASELRIAGWKNPKWKVTDLGGGFEEIVGDELRLRPGIYKVHAAAHGVTLRIAVPAGDGYGFTEQNEHQSRAITFADFDMEVPAGMTRIPAGPAVIDAGEDVPAFCASRDFVTNERFSEWLDDLSDAERRERVPSRGFRRSESDTRRWLVEPDAASKPVLGIPPAHAREYARWRAAADGVAYALPTAEQWNRMAAIDAMRTPGYAPLFRWRAHSGPTDVFSPHGVRHIFQGPGEIVSAGAEDGFLLKGRGGILPLPSAVERSEPIEPDATGHGYGFRLVLRP